MTADIAGIAFDLYALAVFGIAAVLILIARALRARKRRRAWWRW